MILDLERGDCPRELHCDVAVVGAGAVGIVMAIELARRGADVLLVEGGGASLEASSQALYQGSAIGHHLGGLHEGRFRLLGGTTNFWGGQLVRFDPIVFEDRPWIGGAGWPFGRRDIDPYYDRCGRLLGLPEGVEDQTLWSRLAITPPDFGADLELFLTRWLRDPNFTHLFREELAAPSLRTLVHANAVGLILGSAGHITGVHAKTLAGTSAVIGANHVVLACGTIEISRLLMQPLADGSTAPWATNPWLGKGFLDHVHCIAGSVRVLDRDRFHEIFDNLYIDRWKYNPKLKLAESRQSAAKTLGIAGHFFFDSAYREHLDSLKQFARSILNGRMPSAPWRLPGHVAEIWKVAGPLAVRYLRSNRAFNPSGAVELHVTAEQWPNPQSRIGLQQERDVLGLPKVAVDWALNGREMETIALFSERVRDAVRRLGLADIDLDPLLVARDPRLLETASDGFHHMGGARIGASAEQGVVDADLKVHGTQNLYVAGAAVYPSSGFANPTFTAMALGLRLCDNLVRFQP